MVRLKDFGTNFKKLFKEYGRMDNQEAEKKVKFSKWLHSIGFPKCRNRFIEKWIVFEHFGLYSDKQAFIYFWLIRDWRRNGSVLASNWTWQEFHFLHHSLFVHYLLKILDLRRLHIYLSCLIIIWSGTDP